MFYNSHRKLRVWQEAMKLVSEVYKLQQTFPKYETYALCDQLRRAVVSIPTNIAEGNARQYEKEKRQFFYIALGSLAEVSTLLDVAESLSYIQNSTDGVIDGRSSTLRAIDERCETISRMLSGFVDSSGSAIGHRPSNAKDFPNA